MPIIRITADYAVHGNAEYGCKRLQEQMNDAIRCHFSESHSRGWDRDDYEALLLGVFAAVVPDPEPEPAPASDEATPRPYDDW